MSKQHNNNQNNLAIKAIIFDCDGVLVNTEHLKYQAWKDAFKNHNIDFILQDYLPLIGQSSNSIFGKIKRSKKLNIDNGVSIIQQKNNIYWAKQQAGVPPIKSAIKLAKKLAKDKNALNIKLALASSAPRTEIIANKLGWDRSKDPRSQLSFQKCKIPL